MPQPQSSIFNLIGSAVPLRRFLTEVLSVGLLVAAAVLLLLVAYRLPRSIHFEPDAPPRALALSGFSGVESFPDSNKPFRWSRAEANLRLPNPGIGPLVWHLTFAAGPRGSLPLRLRVGGTQLPAFEVGAARRIYIVLAPQRYHGQYTTVALSAPPARDAAADRRLGVVVGALSLASAAPLAPPLLLLAALAFAAIGAYVLLRQAGCRCLPAAALTVSVLALVVLVQALWLWRWGLAVQFLAAYGLGALVAVVVERYLLAATTVVSSEQLLPQVLVRWPLVVLLLAVLVTRLPLVPFGDPAGDINVAADRAVLLANDGLGRAYHRGNDYLALRQYLLLGIGSLAQSLGIGLDQPLSIAASALLKAPQLLADLLVVGLIYSVARSRGGERVAWAIAALYALTPPVWMNASWWGQVDSLLMLGMLSALLLIERSVVWSWLAWALALQVKAQPVLLVPLMGAATLRLHRSGGIALGAPVMLVVLALGALPLIIAGQMAGLLTAYEGSIDRYPYTSVSAYNLWYLFHGIKGLRDSEPLLLGLRPLQIGLFLLSLACLIIVAALFRRTDLDTRLEAAATLALAFFCLTTQMHQRYLVFVFPFLALRTAKTPRLLLPYLLLTIAGTLNIFGTLPFVPATSLWIASSSLPTLAACANLGVLALLLFRLLRVALAR